VVMAELSTEEAETQPGDRGSTHSTVEESKSNATSSPTRTSPAESREQTVTSESAPSSNRVSMGNPNSSKTMPTSASSNSNSARTSPQPATNHLASTSSSNGPSPYGTRSRNRATNRPNYAEDKESEMDFEYTSNKNSQNSTSTSQTSQPMQRKSSTGVQSKKATPNVSSAKAAPTAPAVVPKDPIPGTSTFSVNAESKKRKAPGGNTPTTSSPAQTTAPTTRKSSHSGPSPSPGGKWTNMVSFETHGTTLSNGCLIADDKTKFKVNGMCFFFVL
jgi:hypothetical protein